MRCTPHLYDQAACQQFSQSQPTVVSMGNISEEFIANLARVINSFGVPCVLWGHCLLNAHGIPSIIADEQLQRSIHALSTQTQDLVVCHQPESCSSGSEDRCTPPPAFHMHIRNDLNTTVGLYPQSDTLWFLPPIAKAVVDVSKFTTASNSNVLPPRRPGRGSGVFPNKLLHPVIVPQATLLLESFMRLHARDAGKRIGSFSMAMIDYMELYVDGDGFLDATLLPEPLKWFYQQLKLGDMPVRQWTDELRQALGVQS